MKRILVYALPAFLPAVVPAFAQEPGELDRRVEELCRRLQDRLDKEVKRGFDRLRGRSELPRCLADALEAAGRWMRRAGESLRRLDDLRRRLPLDRIRELWRMFERRETPGEERGHEYDL